MDETQPPTGGILESLRKLGRTGVTVFQNRLELFSVELEEQRVQLVRVLLLAGVAIFMGNAALLAVSAAIVVLAGDHARPAVLVCLSVVYVLAALAGFLALRKELRSIPPPFQNTIAELKKDNDWINPRT